MLVRMKRTVIPPGGGRPLRAGQVVTMTARELKKRGATSGDYECVRRDATGRLAVVKPASKQSRTPRDKQVKRPRNKGI